MPDREKVAKDLTDIGGFIAGRVGFERARNFLHTIDEAVAMLKEQDREKERIMKVIWDALHEGFSIDTIADQDWVYEQIRHRIEDI